MVESPKPDVYNPPGMHHYMCLMVLQQTWNTRIKKYLEICANILSFLLFFSFFQDVLHSPLFELFHLGLRVPDRPIPYHQNAVQNPLFTTFVLMFLIALWWAEKKRPDTGARMERASGGRGGQKFVCGAWLESHSTTVPLPSPAQLCPVAQVCDLKVQCWKE